MKITSIKQQIKRTDRYSIFVDGKYAFSLSEAALLESKLASGDVLTAGQLKEFKKLSEDDKIYNQTLRYIALRPRSKWEIEFYLQRKKTPLPQIEIILNKLSIIGLVDDEKFAQAFVNDRRLLKPTSRRKLTLELRKKRISPDIIEQALGSEHADEQTALQATIGRKRRQTKYQDDQKLMQYLARQGFNYHDIKAALTDDD
ncbi:MAG TPA: RecX family transcriptional regulator [Candidatus Saccharimonadales bacterium]|nr:RecX family transcriptional regulator [Candidatus Saccharimonadales bacterium]